VGIIWGMRWAGERTAGEQNAMEMLIQRRRL